jgi:hypothetical protein
VQQRQQRRPRQSPCPPPRCHPLAHESRSTCPLRGKAPRCLPCRWIPRTTAHRRQPHLRPS